MKAKSILAGIAKSVATLALISAAGVTVAPGLASAASVKLYVTPAADGGVDTGHCTLASRPCATIAYALKREASLAPNSLGSTISLSKGTFNDPSDAMFAALTPANSNVTVTGTGGKGKRATIVEPTSCSSLDGPTVDGSAMVAFQTGENGITLSNATLSGAFVSSCAGYQAGVLMTEATQGNAIVGDIIASGAFYGILTDAGAASTISNSNVSAILCTSGVKGPDFGLNQGWSSPINLNVVSIPNCAQFRESGHSMFTDVSINGISYCAQTSQGKNTLVLTGNNTAGACTPVTSGPEIPTGSTVSFNSSAAAFIQFGIACNSPVGATNNATDCAISGNTVTAGGVVLTDSPTPGGVPPIGIVVTGLARADIDGNSVSGVSDNIAIDPALGNWASDGIGIGLLPDAFGASAGNTVVGANVLNSPNTGHGNDLSRDDIGILVVAGDNSPVNTYQVNANTVNTGTIAGIVLQGLGAERGSAAGSLAAPMESNSVQDLQRGDGIELLGDVGQTIGGPLSTQGNIASQGEFGIFLGPCTTARCHVTGDAAFGQASTANLLQNNTADDNFFGGVMNQGKFQPNEEVPQIPALAEPALGSTGNTFNKNSWTDNPLNQGPVSTRRTCWTAPVGAAVAQAKSLRAISVSPSPSSAPRPGLEGG